MQSEKQNDWREAMRNLIVLARPHFSDQTQMLALQMAEDALGSPSPETEHLGSVAIGGDTPPVDGAAEQLLTDLRRFVNLIEGRAMACDGPVTPFLEELNASSDEDKERFIGILRALYALAEGK